MRWVYDRFFSHIQVDESWTSSVRDAAYRGTVVYVMRSISFLDFLCLDYLVKRLELPLVRFVNDLGLWVLEPFGKGRRRWQQREQIPEDRALRAALHEQLSALIFLRRPPGFARRQRRGEQLEVDLMRVLVAAQRETRVPILLMPQTFVWHKLPSRPNSVLDLVLGPSEWPGRVRVLFQFLRNYRHALLRSGVPFDLRTFLDANPDLDDAAAADKVRWAMLRRIERERTIVLGPRKKTPERMREELVRSPRLRRQLTTAARASGQELESTLRQAEHILRRLGAAPDPFVLSMWHHGLDYVWNRIYDGVELDRDGLRRLREASRHGTLVLLPTHKSHVDYLVLSDVFYGNDLWPPMVAAGDNLSFFPLGPCLRRAGAFFIRRSIKGQKIYSAVLDAYVRKLLQEGFAIELFMEGGRSRTGKLLRPQLGLISMVVDAALSLPSRKVFFVPISIGYESIIEERSYVSELEGADKEQEDITGLLRTSRSLGSGRGQLYVQFGNLLEIGALIQEVAAEPCADRHRPVLSAKQRRTLVNTIAHRAMHEIERVTVVTPASLVATALLSHRRPDMSETELVRRASQLLVAARRAGARFTTPVTTDRGALRVPALGEAVRSFARRKLLTVQRTPNRALYRVPVERRIALEYYKNNILHFYAPCALLATALVAEREQAIAESVLSERFQELCELLKHEFVAPPDQSPPERFVAALTAMQQSGEVIRQNGMLHPGVGEPGAVLTLQAELLRSYLESYLLALKAARLLEAGPMPRKDWLKKALALGNKCYLAGELEYREAMSRVKLDNALKALHDRGLLRHSGEQVALGPRAEHAEALVDHERAVARYL